jgi:glutaredoxin
MRTYDRRRHVRLLIPFLILCALTSMANAEVYRWTDEHGRIHFGDRPPAGTATEQVQVHINTYSAPQIVSRPSDRNVKPTKRESVVMYSASWCGVCKRAATYFRAKGIPYRDYDVETSAKGRADFKRLGGRGVPIILVGEARMNGFSPAHFEQLYFR